MLKLLLLLLLLLAGIAVIWLCKVVVAALKVANLLVQGVPNFLLVLFYLQKSDVKKPSKIQHNITYTGQPSLEIVQRLNKLLQLGDDQLRLDVGHLSASVQKR